MRATVTFKNAQNGQFSELLKIEATSVNSVTRPVCFNKTKIGRKCQSGQKFIKNAKNSLYWRVEACSQTVVPDVCSNPFFMVLSVIDKKTKRKPY